MMIRNVAKRKEPETPSEYENTQRNVAYCVGGFFCGQKLTEMLEQWMIQANNKPATLYSRLLRLPMKQQSNVFIAMFIAGSDKIHCVLFDRHSGDRSISELTRIKVRFEIQPNALWDDDYCSMQVTKHTIVTTKSHTTQEEQQRPVTTLSSLDATTFAPTPGLDVMADFTTKDWTLVNRTSNFVLPNLLACVIAAKCSVLQNSCTWHDALCIIKLHVKDGSSALDVINVIGQSTHCVRILFKPNKSVSFQSAVIDRLKRCNDELELGSLLWDGMNSTELAAFTASEFENILNQTQDTNSKLPLMEPTIHGLNLEQEGERCQTWMRFVRSQLAPKTCFGMNFVTIKLLRIPVARCKFELQVLEMKNTNTPIQPHIMFHGVRGEHVTRTVDSICKNGFNPKYTQNCVYGAGGTYCSPQFACALDFTTTTTNNQKFVFVCMVVPGKVCYDGQNGQLMAPDQHSWAHGLENGQQIYCSETILPIALLTFVP